MLLEKQAPTVGPRLQEFRRERAARESFRAEGRERALAPDALIHLHDEQGRGLLGFVELRSVNDSPQSIDPNRSDARASVRASLRAQDLTDPRRVAPARATRRAAAA